MTDTYVKYPATTASDVDFPHNTSSAHHDLSDGSDGTWCTKQGYAGETHSCYGSTLTTTLGPEVASVVSVRPIIRVKCLSGNPLAGATPYCGFTSGGTNFNAFTGVVVSGEITTFTQYNGTTYTTDPKTGLAWTPTTVNALGWFAGETDIRRDGEALFVSELFFNVVVILTPPTITTTAATNIIPTSAALTLDFVTNGNDINYYWQWGLTAAYGNETTHVFRAGSTSGVNGVFQYIGSLSGGASLTPNTIYHFRGLASYASGTVTGSDLTFTTTSVDPTVLSF